MKQVIKLTESDLHRIVKQVISEEINELKGRDRRIIAKYGKDSVDATIAGSPTLPSGRSTPRTLQQVAIMDEESIYMMLRDFKLRPFTFAINYQGIDVIIEFWVENMVQSNTKFTVGGTMFMKNGARKVGRLIIDVSTDYAYIKIRGDRTTYSIIPCKNVSYWESFIQELKDSIL